MSKTNNPEFFLSITDKAKKVEPTLTHRNTNIRTKYISRFTRRGIEFKENMRTNMGCYRTNSGHQSVDNPNKKKRVLQELGYIINENYPNDGVKIHKTHTHCHQMGLPTKYVWDIAPITHKTLSLNTTFKQRFHYYSCFKSE